MHACRDELDISGCISDLSATAESSQEEASMFSHSYSVTFLAYNVDCKAVVYMSIKGEKMIPLPHRDKVCPS